MGTSSMYVGPNRSPLLPSDFDDGNSDHPDKPNNDPEQKQDGDKPENEKPSEKPRDDDSPSQESTSNNTTQNSPWTRAKTSMSKYASGHGGRNGKENALSDYVKGHGGSRNAAKSAKSAIRTTINIGDFFGGVSKKGISQVLKEFQISTEGRKPKEILNDIVNILAPTPDLNDDSVARKALIDTMSIIYEKFDDEKQDITLLDSIDPDISKMLVEKYIETFIYERLIHDVGSRIEKKAENSAAAAKIEQELKDYIETKVSTTLKDKPLSIINSETKNIHVLVEELYQQCYKVLEDQL
ncbi:Qat anti-phage system associated protein QatB [Macellibacteroides fermentans]|uniref:Qat anti-phage system associated protein QatB n=1 Tax=Macellibacteroides fermentans TaxID=879969 RepID=UPI002B3DBCF7|nr:Qat anti-phage system associated protein QatB [Macellibacteroides fermentans]